MKIVVCIKQVPDTNEVKLDPKTNRLIRDGVPSIINHDDKSGIEAALQLKEKVGGTVTVVCMGPPQAVKFRQMREQLALENKSFSVSAFHEAILRTGPSPFSVLEETVRDQLK